MRAYRKDIIRSIIKGRKRFFALMMITALGVCMLGGIKAGCDDCKGCSSCCRGMGNSIVLDPYDVYRLTTGLNCRFEDLLIDKLDLNVVDGIILPNLKMTGER